MGKDIDQLVFHYMNIVVSYIYIYIWSTPENDRYGGFHPLQLLMDKIRPSPAERSDLIIAGVCLGGLNMDGSTCRGIGKCHP